MHCWAKSGRSREISGEIRTCRKLPGEIRTPRTVSGRNWTLRSLRVSECRPTTSLLSKCRPKTKRRPNVARKRSGVRKSPDNTTMFRSRPKTLRRARGRHAADEWPARSPWRSICNPNAISCITLGATRPVKPAEPTTRRSAKKSFSLKMPPATARFRFRSDTRQIFVRYFGIFPASVSSHQ